MLKTNTFSFYSSVLTKRHPYMELKLRTSQWSNNYYGVPTIPTTLLTLSFPVSRLSDPEACNLLICRGFLRGALLQMVSPRTPRQACSPASTTQNWRESGGLGPMPSEPPSPHTHTRNLDIQAPACEAAVLVLGPLSWWHFLTAASQTKAQCVTCGVY